MCRVQPRLNTISYPVKVELNLTGLKIFFVKFLLKNVNCHGS